MLYTWHKAYVLVLLTVCSCEINEVECVYLDHMKISFFLKESLFSWYFRFYPIHIRPILLTISEPLVLFFIHKSNNRMIIWRWKIVSPITNMLFFVFSLIFNVYVAPTIQSLFFIYCPWGQFFLL